MAKRADPAEPRYASGLTTDDPLLRLARRVLHVERDALRALLPRGGEAPTAEQVHQLRITTRRIRVALQLFEGLMPRNAAALRTELQWFGRALGDVRDLDVYAESLAAGAGATAEAVNGLAALEHLQHARDEARQRLNEILESDRFALLSAALDEFGVHGPEPGALRRWKSLRIVDAARGDARKGVKRVLKVGRKIDAESPPERLHRLRIRAKRLRYELEFYEDLYPALRSVTRAAKRLQDTLGAYRDASMAAERLRAAAGRNSRAGRKRARGAHAESTQTLIRRQLEIAAEARQQLESDWRRFVRAAAAAKLDAKRR